MHKPEYAKGAEERRNRYKLLEYPMVEKTIDIGWEFEIDVEVYFDYTPEEESGMYSAGSNAAVDIYAVHRVDNGAEICLMPEEQERLEEEILCESHDHHMDLAYGDPYEWVR